MTAELYYIFACSFLFLSFVYVISGLDDLFIDLTAIAYSLKPAKISKEFSFSLKTSQQKPLAIVMPAWDEGDIIAAMLEGNLKRIDYENYHFFVGVYPNDPTTIAEVERVSRLNPRVHAVVNTQAGPTSKGQMLNQVVAQILEFERQNGFEFEGLLMQDSEDVIHPQMLRLMNHAFGSFDFVQTPVFSLPVAKRYVVGGTYMDEFAEWHTKDLLVREKLCGAVPSAGVGTGLSRRLISNLLQERSFVFNENSLTEDYELGVNAGLRGFRSHFACYFFEKEDGTHEYIATREYFPKNFWRSVRQKARWTVGIAFQGSKHLGWQGSLANRYFLWRDRKGIFTNPASLLGYVLLFLCLSVGIWDGSFSSLNSLFGFPLAELLVWAGGFNAFLAANRVVQKSLGATRVYGLATVPFTLLRWPIAIVVNGFAVGLAFKQVLWARVQKKTVSWAKTQHEVPEFFVKAQPALSLSQSETIYGAEEVV